MAAEGTTEGTEAPGGNAGLPQFDVQTYPSQVFWLAVTFGLLFLVLWKKTLPMITATIAARRNRIEGDLGAAEGSRKNAADALQAYEAALTQARSRAVALADENRKRVVAELDKAKAEADAAAHAAMSEAEKKIGADRERAAASVRASAAEAAAAIVERLIGEKVSPAEAEGAVPAGSR
jgi:F-type H+-transporting ATPase subunit b